ncbi:MAG: diguanylate cyclase, partial [Oscillospiraceae bacterium]
IDVDNFKNINDNFGHLCGDAVLANMAHSLKNIFRSNDILGRIGGDEFLVFMSNVPNHNTIKKKAMQVVNIFEGKQMEREAGLSCSVGIALCPQDANDYLKLTKCADSALYKIKNTGKMGFAFFDESMQNNIPSQIMRLAIKEKINDNANTMLYEEIMQYTFKLLYNSVDIKTAINQILEMIGQAYDVSRVYVFETSDDGKYCSNTFEWCNNGVTSQMNNLQNLSFEDDLVGFFEIFDENGVFYCQNIKMLNKELYSILEMQGVVSVLQCFIKEDGCFKGYVGFDECKTSRYWTEEQVDSLTMVSNVLSTFLLKLRLKEEVERLKKEVKN